MENRKKIPLWHPAYGTVLAFMSIYILCMTIASYPSSLYLPHIVREFGVNQGTVQLRLTVCALASLAVLPFVNKLYGRFGFKRLTILGLILFACAYVGYAISPNIAVYLCFAAVNGIGNALALFVPGPYMLNAWFNKGTAIAFLLAQAPSSLIATFTTPLISKMVDAYGWRLTMAVTILVGAALSIAMCLLFADPTPESKGLRPFGDEEGEGHSGPLVVRGVSEKVAKKSPILYMFVFIAVSCILLANLAMFTNAIALQNGFSTEQGASAISMYTAAVTVTLILSSFAINKIGVRRFTLIGCAIDILALLLLIFNGGNFTVFTAGLCLAALNGMQHMSNLATKEVFGIMDYPAIYSVINLGFNFSNMVGPSAYGYICDFTGSYDLMLWIVVGLTAGSMVCTVLIYKLKDSLPWEERVVGPAA